MGSYNTCTLPFLLEALHAPVQTFRKRFQTCFSQDAAGLVAHVETEEDMRIICAQTSVFVAACEAVTGQPLKGINRHPSTVEDRAENMSVVIQRIAALLNTDLNHLSGARIACGDLKDIFNLVEILAALTFVSRQSGVAPHMPSCLCMRPTSCISVFSSVFNLYVGGGNRIDMERR